MIGQYTPSRLQINELLFTTTATTNILNETYDIITLSQLKR
ncbi:hypothetical protein CRENPOLYSF2_2760010 [Crenothrix polyspora]|uniref:Uncharacterized protein n=1 Tax=Crenothrix polyspora TaxID=360316 RepID=A0A1R4H8H8_9GAMM|nr:hypothetical protein CRENPOLYSF2_2760010 [Crenothrix polyspora]